MEETIEDSRVRVKAPETTVDELQEKLARIRAAATKAKAEDRLPYKDSDTWTDQLPLD